jgi:hypothetical protein
VSNYQGLALFRTGGVGKNLAENEALCYYSAMGKLPETTNIPWRKGDESVYKALQELAGTEERSTRLMAKMLVREGLVARGLLAKEKGPETAAPVEPSDAFDWNGIGSGG